jgi:hypothetical protein
MEQKNFKPALFEKPIQLDDANLDVLKGFKANVAITTDNSIRIVLPGFNSRTAKAILNKLKELAQ